MWNNSDVTLETPISFTGSETEKLETFSVKFQDSVLDFIPDNLVQVFPNISALWIVGGTVSVCSLDEGFLHEGLAAITYLGIKKTPLNRIDQNAFKKLINLEKLTLSDCKIKSLPYKYFKHNPNLSEIDLTSNEIHMINVRLFDGLNSLRWMIMSCKSCVQNSWFINLVNSTDKIFDSIQSLKQCYKNCLKDDVCLLESEVGPEDPLRQEIAVRETVLVSSKSIFSWTCVTWDRFGYFVGFVGGTILIWLMEFFIAKSYCDWVIENRINNLIAAFAAAVNKKELSKQADQQE
jgi:hypothetical protein